MGKGSGNCNRGAMDLLDKITPTDRVPNDMRTNVTVPDGLMLNAMIEAEKIERLIEEKNGLLVEVQRNRDLRQHPKFSGLSDSKKRAVIILHTFTKTRLENALSLIEYRMQDYENKYGVKHWQLLDQQKNLG